MIRAEFLQSEGKYRGFRVKGHAGYAESGQDIVCASVSSAVMLAANIITDGFKRDADVFADNDAVSCVAAEADEVTEAVIGMLRAQFEAVLEEFPDTIKITISEV
ncbi:MAG: ribosomal-processing cysteine protease Prp [Lachnospiraceae bacterium]|nr:ribosomal-processing cysteine protease Prp [Lachnospiraceae bacterium]MBR4361593.1 ribosomal-processing cysteine protease Prp [Ruminococcus sp.]